MLPLRLKTTLRGPLFALLPAIWTTAQPAAATGWGSLKPTKGEPEYNYRKNHRPGLNLFRSVFHDTVNLNLSVNTSKVGRTTDRHERSARHVVGMTGGSSIGAAFGGSSLLQLAYSISMSGASVATFSPTSTRICFTLPA